MNSHGMFGNYTIAATGCVPCSATMILNAFNGSSVTCQEICTRYSGDALPSGGAQFELIQKIGQDYGFNANVDYSATTLPVESLVNHIRAGGIAVINVYYNANVGHAVVINGFYENGKYLHVTDPGNVIGQGKMTAEAVARKLYRTNNICIPSSKNRNNK